MKKVLIVGLVLLAGISFAADVEAVNTRQGYTTLYEVRDQLNNLAEGGTLTNGLTVGAGGLTVSAGGATIVGDVTVDGALVGEPGMVVVTDTNAYTVLSANAGKVHFMPDLTADSTLTLPAEAAGLSYEFVYAGGAADAHDWTIDTGADANYFVGGLVQSDPDDGGDDTVVYYSDGDSNSKLGVLTPEAGTVVKLWCQNGTNWYVSGAVISATDAGVTFADQ